MEENKNTFEVATFAAGCFWHVEEVFRNVPGVKDVVVGYTGGNMPNPTYEQVCTGKTEHAEAVEVTFDPKTAPYEKLLDVFWENHDPTTPDRQGPDRGSQYRSAIFFHTSAQEHAARMSKESQEKSGTHRNPIVTHIVPAGPFYRAEEYHQQYLKKHGLSVCPA